MTQSSDGSSSTGSPETDSELAARRERLSSELKRRSDLKEAEDAGTRKPRSDASGLARALRVSSEFVAGVIAGGVVGWIFDHFLGTRPWGMIVFLLLGFAAGTLNVMRSAGLKSSPGGTTSEGP